jgi:transposase, IS30 family
MANHRDFTRATNAPVYFCDPQSPWQRGSNENTNGLLRQYLPKGHDLSIFTQEQLNAIATLLNHRPRKTLAFRNPLKCFLRMLHRQGDSLHGRSQFHRARLRVIIQAPSG